MFYTYLLDEILPEDDLLQIETCRRYKVSKVKPIHWKSVPIIQVLLPTNAQENCFKRNINIYIKTAPTCFGVITIIRKRTIWVC